MVQSWNKKTYGQKVSRVKQVHSSKKYEEYTVESLAENLIGISKNTYYKYRLKSLKPRKRGTKIYPKKKEKPPKRDMVVGYDYVYDLMKEDKNGMLYVIQTNKKGNEELDVPITLSEYNDTVQEIVNGLAEDLNDKYQEDGSPVIVIIKQITPIVKKA